MMPPLTRPQCPFGEECGCTVMTRHEWYECYCRAADLLRELRTDLAATKAALIDSLNAPAPGPRRVK